MGKRASLTNLADNLVRKNDEPSDAAPAQLMEGRRKRAKSQPDGRKGVLVRAKKDAWRLLKGIAIDEERTLQDLMEEAIDDFLEKKGKPRAAGR